jgi:hypothetical protein
MMVFSKKGEKRIMGKEKEERKSDTKEKNVC